MHIYISIYTYICKVLFRGSQMKNQSFFSRKRFTPYRSFRFDTNFY